MFQFQKRRLNLADYTPGNSREIITWLINAPTRAVAMQRLNMLSARTKLDSLKKYVDEELKHTIEYWLVCYRVWSFTCGLSATTMMENMHNSFKSPLGNNQVPLHHLPDFFRGVMKRRQLKIDDRNDRSITLDNFIDQAKKSGHSSLVVALSSLCTKATQSRVLDQFSRGFNYSSKPINLFSFDSANLPVAR